MSDLIDIDVILDDNFPDPKITIHTRTRNSKVESIINAIEQVAENEYPLIPAYSEDKLELISQRDIIRIYTHGRKLNVEAGDKVYTVNKSLSIIEAILSSERFIRISQSEIVNLYKVKHFEFSKAGTVGIEFENGEKSWASRSRVKAIKEMLKGR